MIRYTKFIIRKYRAISNDLVVKIPEQGVLPIIGINECGKTTILQAIFAFDYNNDKDNDRYKQLSEVTNLYKIKGSEAIITAELICRNNIINDLFTRVKDSVSQKPNEDETKSFQQKFPYGEQEDCLVIITRTINGKGAYRLELTNNQHRENVVTFESKNFNQELSKEIINNAPSIIYYDDFRDRIADEINITNISHDETVGFSINTLKSIFEEAYKNHNEDNKITFEEMCGYSDEGKIKTALYPVNTLINKRLTDKWKILQKMDDKENNEIKIELYPTVRDDEKFIKIQALETINVNGEDESKYFDISRRSKGFYWFFNFTLKTAFNPKTLTNKSTIYLLDEPGCYLHASAQRGLCKILDEDIAQNQVVIYNTHSHYLIDKKFIPKARTAFKKDGNIFLTHFSEYDGSSDKKYDALQPLKDALRVEPSVFDEEFGKNKLVILEGISDFCSFDLFCNDNEIGFLMARGDGSPIDYCSVLLCQKRNFICALDGDEKGKETKEKIKNEFDDLVKVELYGDGITLEKLYDKEEITSLVQEYGSQINTNNKNSVEKFIYYIYTISNKDEVIGKMPKTQQNFKEVFNRIKNSFSRIKNGQSDEEGKLL